MLCSIASRATRMKKDAKERLVKLRAGAAGVAASSNSAEPSAFNNALTFFRSTPVLQVVAVIIAVAFSGYIYQQGGANVQNLINGNAETLKSVLLGDKPFLFYCHRGGKQEAPPVVFTELNALKGGKVGFALLNCSQVMPSGKSIQDRFGLKKVAGPLIFAAAPWMKPKQVPPGQMKDVTSLRKYVDAIMAPRAVDIITDKELRSHCGFKNTTRDEHSIGDTCIVLLKGKRHKNEKKYIDLEEALIRAYPRTKMVSLDAAKRRLSFEDTEALPAENFAIKVHALRNGTHSLSMVNPVTRDNLHNFVAHALGVMLLSYDGEGTVPVQIVKTGAASSAFKDRSARFTQPPTSGGGSKSKRRGGKRDGDGDTADQGSSGGSGADSGKAPEETEAERQARESRRREQMERQARERLFEETEGEGEGGEDQDSDEGEDELIEL